MAADIPKQEEMGFLQQGEEEDQRRGLPERKKTQRPEGSVVVDMDGLSLLAAAAASPRAPMILQKILTRKLSQRGGERKTAGDGDALILPATTSAAGSGDGKVTVPPSAAVAVPAAGPNSDKFVAIAISPTVVASEIAAPTSAAAAAASPRRTNSSCKRAYGRRAAAASPWLDPRWVLLFFATMSSMGTIILLYFTLSMGTIGDGGDANAR